MREVPGSIPGPGRFLRRGSFAFDGWSCTWQVARREQAHPWIVGICAEQLALVVGAGQSKQRLGTVSIFCNALLGSG